MMGCVLCVLIRLRLVEDVLSIQLLLLINCVVFSVKGHIIYLNLISFAILVLILYLDALIASILLSVKVVTMDTIWLKHLQDLEMVNANLAPTLMDVLLAITILIAIYVFKISILM